MIAIICVIYKPNNDNIRNLQKYIDSYNYIQYVIVDNTPNDCINYQFSSLHHNLSHIRLGDNIGIAAAQNIGITKAKERGYKYIIFFDQDSEYDIDFINGLIKEYEKIKHTDKKIATLGPLIIDKTTNEAYKSEIDIETPFKSVETIISSGSIVETINFDIIGGLDDKLFIDLVDHEWCWRAKSLGYNCYQTTRVSLNHKVGNCNKTVLGFPIIISAPFRYYYKYRNYLLLINRPYVPMEWKVKGLIRRIVEIMVVPFMAKNLSIYKFIFKGIKDGLIRK